MTKVLRTPRLARLALTLALALGGAVLLVRPAAGETSIGVTPSVAQLAVDAGATERRDLTVSNEGDEPFTVAAGVSALDDAPEASSAVPWVTVEPSGFDLGPGETRAVRVVVDPPADLASGGAYAVVTLTTGARAVDGAGTAVAGQVGVPILITVDGTGDPLVRAEVERFAAVLEPDGRVGFRAEVRNTGNTHVVLRGETVLTEADGTAVERGTLGTSTVVLPGDRTVVEGAAPLLLESGRRYRATAELDFGGAGPLVGQTEFTTQAPRVEMRGLELCERADGGLQLGFLLDNPGSLGVVPVATLTARSVADPAGGRPARLGLPVAWPDQATGYSLDALGALDDGTYELALTVESGPTTRLNRLLAFHVGGEAGVAPCKE